MPGFMMNNTDLAHLIDHTILRPEATNHEIVRAAQEAVRFQVATLCVAPSMVHFVKEAQIPIPLSAVVGFPTGKHLRAIKAYETALAVDAGAVEIDMVIDLGAMIAGDYSAVYNEIRQCRQAIPTGILKVIIESALLQQYGGDNIVIKACHIAAEAGADFVKTSTGFHPAGGATVSAVQLIAHTVGSSLGVKASGGIRTRNDAIAMVRAGATRLGLSRTAEILQ